MKPEAVNVILYCARWYETVRFYRDTIGFPARMMCDWLVAFDVAPNVHLSVADESATSVKSAGGAGITVTFKVPDVHGAWRRLTDKGVEVGAIRHSCLGGEAFFLHDPEGNRLEFWSET